jgi:hypothetical protein
VRRGGLQQAPVATGSPSSQHATQTCLVLYFIFGNEIPLLEFFEYNRDDRLAEGWLAGFKENLAPRRYGSRRHPQMANGPQRDVTVWLNRHYRRTR